MKKFIVSTTLLFTVAALSAFGESMTGFVGDAACAAKGKANAEAHAACAEKCIKGGSAPVLVVGDKVYKISNPDKVAEKAGKKVTVDASVSGDTVTLNSVE